jgi:hypothetical protein
MRHELSERYEPRETTRVVASGIHLAVASSLAALRLRATRRRERDRVELVIADLPVVGLGGAGRVVRVDCVEVSTLP